METCHHLIVVKLFYQPSQVCFEVEEDYAERLEEGGDTGDPVATIAVDESAAPEAFSLMEKESKKRKAEDYSHASTQWWKKHFVMLEEFHYSILGKKGHRPTAGGKRSTPSC